jgi:hypothetical protein
LDLRCLRFEGCLKLRNGCFQFLHLAMLFEELVEQHRVHGFVANGVGFSLFIASRQIRVHLFHLLGHEAELRNALEVKLLLVAEGHRPEREDRFTSFDRVFVAG